MLNTFSQPKLREIFSNAFQWLKRSRKHYPSSSDIWDFRRSWDCQSEGIIRMFKRGSYLFGTQKRIRLLSGETIHLWSASDALVVKVITGLIQQRLQPTLSKSCYHVKGKGGLKRAVNEVLKKYPKYKFFCKTDVKSYYESIEHYILVMKLHRFIFERKIIWYVWQFLRRTVEWGGLYEEQKKGISRGSSLSPLLGAFYLLDLDKRLEKLDIKYFRYMDDILILAPTRWKLRKSISVLNQTFNELRLEKHPEKTIIGKTEKGFDFLGYHFSPEGLGVAKNTIDKFLLRAVRLYEQEQGEPFGSPLLGLYVKRWVRWAKGGIR